MNELNKTDSNNVDVNKNNQANKPSQNLIQSFKTLFSKAKENIESKPTESTKSESKEPINGEPLKEKKSAEDNNQKSKNLEFKIKQDDPILKQIFSDMGINNIQQIDSILIQVTKHIESITQIPNTQQVFHIKINNEQTKLAIETITKNHKLTVNLIADKELIALLNAHLPELKKYLKKKKITIDNLNLIDEEKEGTKNQKNPLNKK